MRRRYKQCGNCIVVFIFMFMTLIIGMQTFSDKTGLIVDTECGREFELPETIHRFSCEMEEPLSGHEVPTDRLEFPKHIHQMFFYETDRTIPKRLETARRTWINNQRHFRYTLWNSSMVETLIKTKYCELFELYQSYDHWVRRADMARYIVLYEYGGVYIDIDIKSKYESLTNLISGLKNTSGIALYVTQPAVVTNDFMIAKPKHPFMRSVLCGLKSSNHWLLFPYLTTMTSTGPLYLHRRYMEHSPTVDIEILNSTKLSDYITHIRGAAWHQWDGKVIWWIFQNTTSFIKLCLAVICSVLVLFCLWKHGDKLSRLKSGCARLRR